MMQQDIPEYFIRVGIKENKVVSIDYTGLATKLFTKKEIERKVINLLTFAIKKMRGTK